MAFGLAQTRKDVDEWAKLVLQSDLRASEKTVAWALSRRINFESLQLNPSTTCIARDTNQTIRAVEKQLARLRKAGFVTWTRPGGRGSNRYCLCLPISMPNGGTVFDPEQRDGIGANDTERWDGVTPNGGTVFDPEQRDGIGANDTERLDGITPNGGTVSPRTVGRSNLERNLEKNLIGGDHLKRLRRRVGEKAWSARFSDVTFEPPANVLFESKLRFEYARSEFGEIFHDLGLTPKLAEAA